MIIEENTYNSRHKQQQNSEGRGLVQRGHTEVLGCLVNRDVAGKKFGAWKHIVAVCPFAILVTSAAAFHKTGLHFLVHQSWSVLFSHVFTLVHQSDITQDTAFAVGVCLMAANEGRVDRGNIRLEQMRKYSVRLVFEQKSITACHI